MAKGVYMSDSLLENTHKTSQAKQNLQDKDCDVQDFEAVVERAREMLEKLNTQENTLKDSLALYEEGMRCLKSAQKILEQAQLQYQEIKD